MPIILIPLLVLAAAAQTAPPQANPPVQTGRHWTRMFISPMGEPFRPNGRQDDALADWFAAADKNHDGRLLIEEMQQDAERFFAVLDANHDGEIDPDEISHYETAIAPEVTAGSSYGIMMAASDSSAGGHRRGGRSMFKGADTDQHQGAGRFGLLDLPEPVVSADSNFNRGVSLSEFRQAAAQRFLALDLDHHGYLTLPGLESIRPAPPVAPKKVSRPDDPDESALPDEQGPG